MNQEQRPRWWPTRRQLLWAGSSVALAFVIIVIGGYLFGWKWTGLPKRTLWDWLELLIIPAVLAGGGLWFNRQQREQELQTADRRAQDEALQAYLDQMSSMLLPNSGQPSLYKARPGDSLSSVARARTLTVLSRLEGERKGRVVQFLYESGLITSPHPVLRLGGADLSGADLFRASLSGAFLDGAYVSGANLSGADLRGADLSGAILSEAVLSGAILNQAQLIWTDLRWAFIHGADLSGADLHGATLDGAELDGVDLTHSLVTEEQLERVKSLKGATTPTGQKYEDWLEDH